MLEIGKFVDIASRLESEMLEDLERALFVQNADVHYAGLADNFCRIIALDKIDCDLCRIARDLRYRVDDLTVCLLAVVAGRDIQTVTDLVQCLRINIVVLFHLDLVIALCQFLSHRFKLFSALIIERGQDRDIVLGISNVLEPLHLFLHQLFQDPRLLRLCFRQFRPSRPR